VRLTLEQRIERKRREILTARILAVLDRLTARGVYTRGRMNELTMTRLVYEDALVSAYLAGKADAEEDSKK
jgi:hypothetical protein